MTCRHGPGDINCSATQMALEHKKLQRAERKKKKEEALTPDVAKYEVVTVEAVGTHLVMKVKYPNCAKCAYEGEKVMVFLNTSLVDALKWRFIDPHFSDPKEMRGPTWSPAPAARFPASNEGWMDAICYARGKEKALYNEEKGNAC